MIQVIQPKFTGSKTACVLGQWKNATEFLMKLHWLGILLVECLKYVSILNTIS